MLRRLLKRKMFARRFARAEEGTQLVELAIVLPVLLVLFAATAEFGRFFYTYQTLAKSTRASARYLTTRVTEGSTADTVATNLAVYGAPNDTGQPLVAGLGPEHVAITREGGVGTSYERVTVQIDGFQYQPVFDLGKFIGSNTFTLRINISPSTTMRFF